VPRRAAPFRRGVKIYYRCRQRVTAIVGMCFIAGVSGDVADLGKETGEPRIKEEAPGLCDAGWLAKCSQQTERARVASWKSVIQ